MVDLRSDTEVTKEPDILPLQMKYIRIPLFNDDETESIQKIKAMNQSYSCDPHGGHNRMLHVYQKMVTGDQPRRAYQQIFRLLVEDGRKRSFLFHCSAGKDRTGMVAALILAALGVDFCQIKSDYMLTNNVSIPRIERRINWAINENMNEKFIASLFSLSTVSSDYLNEAITLINDSFGNLQNYLKEWVGLTTNSVLKLRQIYLE